MEEDASDTREEIVCIKRKPWRPPTGTGKSKKTTKADLSTMSQLRSLHFSGMLKDWETTKLWRTLLVYLNCIKSSWFFLLNL